MTEAEKVICRLYLEDMDKNHTCNEYKLLMGLLDKEPCEDAISRQAAKDALQEKVFHNLTDEFYGAMQVLDELEPADVAPVMHARWVNYSPVTIKCSRCGHVIHDWRYSECKYCPHCGAKMSSAWEEERNHVDITN